ncbi:MAG: hypothetical protein K2J42_08940 [Muribaculaceae bacterium]|nr:hypothetical protein [Muribaculaceae bacterium]
MARKDGDLPLINHYVPKARPYNTPNRLSIDRRGEVDSIFCGDVLPTARKGSQSVNDKSPINRLHVQFPRVLNLQNYA